MTQMILVWRAKPSKIFGCWTMRVCVFQMFQNLCMGDQSLHVGGYSSAHVKVIIEVLYTGCNSLSKCCTQAAAQFSSARIKSGAEDNAIPLRPNGLTCQAESFLNEVEDPSIEGPLLSRLPAHKVLDDTIDQGLW